MIELFYANTPNGRKISIMLEEIKHPYKVTKVELKEGEQFNPKFRSISPFSKIPVITDHENNISIFESGAILIYLAEKSGKFYDKSNRILINQWLIAQVAYVGPLLGQHHQFHHYSPGKSKWERLEKSKFLAGNEYSIADIATFPWMARHPVHDIGIKKFVHLSRWYKLISIRPAVIKGYDCLNTGEQVPKI